MPESTALSIIVPVLDEAARLDACLVRLGRLVENGASVDIVVVDGGSRDHSREIAARHPCRRIDSPPGRALQMNAGAALARGAALLFLHADSRLPDDFDPAWLAGADWGFFRSRLSGKGWALRVIESAINLRARLTRVAGGDQGLYFSRDCFDAIGGFPALPLMEDIAISKLARRRAAPRIVAAPLTTSSRRWRERGLLRTVALMWWLRFAYWIGVDPRRLHRSYYPR